MVTEFLKSLPCGSTTVECAGAPLKYNNLLVGKVIVISRKKFDDTPHRLYVRIPPGVIGRQQVGLYQYPLLILYHTQVPLDKLKRPGYIARPVLAFYQ